MSKYSYEFKRKPYWNVLKERVDQLHLPESMEFLLKLKSKNGIHTPCIITKWVRDFRIAGPDTLRPKKKGCQKKLNKSTSSNLKHTEGTTIYEAKCRCQYGACRGIRRRFNTHITHIYLIKRSQLTLQNLSTTKLILRDK